MQGQQAHVTRLKQLGGKIWLCLFGTLRTHLHFDKLKSCLGLFLATTRHRRAALQLVEGFCFARGAWPHLCPGMRPSFARVIREKEKADLKEDLELSDVSFLSRDRQGA